MAQLSENFIFIYLGLDLFTESSLQFKPLFILVTVVGICGARFMAVFPLSKAINWFIRYRAKRRGRDVADELPFSYQAMLFWAGLRGAVGVALSAGFEGPNAQAIRATVLVVVVLTVIIFGGTTARMLEILDIRTGVVEEIDSDDEFDIELTNGGTYYKRSGTGIGHNPRRSDFSIPLEAVEASVTPDAEGYTSGHSGIGTPKSSRVSGRDRKTGLFGQRDRKERSRDKASAQTLLGSRGGSRSESSSSSSADGGEASVGGASVSRSRVRAARAKYAADPDADIDDLDFDFDGLSDDGLPPAASGTRHTTGKASPYQQRFSPALATPTGGESSSAAVQSQASASRPTLTGATSAFRDLFSGGREGDHTAWFKQLDEDYIKPKLLLDQNSGQKGPGAV